MKPCEICDREVGVNNANLAVCCECVEAETIIDNGLDMSGYGPDITKSPAKTPIEKLHFLILKGWRYSHSRTGDQPEEVVDFPGMDAALEEICCNELELLYPLLAPAIEQEIKSGKSPQDIRDWWLRRLEDEWYPEMVYSAARHIQRRVNND